MSYCNRRKFSGKLTVKMSNSKSITKIWMCLVAILIISNRVNGKLPSFVKICHRSNPDLNGCLKNTLESLSPALTEGCPELYIPQLEPLVIPEVKLDQSSGAVVVQSSYKNITIKGLSNYTVKKVNTDLKNHNFTVVMNFPRIDLKSDYTISGKILLLPLNGDGICTANFTNVEVTTSLIGSRFISDDKEYLRLEDILVNYTIEKTDVYLDNLFKGDKILGETMNNFINDNWDLVSEEIRPIMEEILSKMLKGTTELIFEQFSLDELIPK